MVIDFEKIKQDKLRLDGGLLWKPKVGDSLFYLCSPPDGVFYVETVFHWNVGKSNEKVACLNKRFNKSLTNPRVAKYLDDKGISISDGCPVCEYIDQNSLWEVDKDAARRIKRSPRFYYLIVPMGHRPSPDEDYVVIKKNHVIRPWCQGKKVWNEIMGVLRDEGDITVMDQAVYFKCNKEGDGLNVKYAISVDTMSLKAPASLPEALRADINNAHKNPNYDLHKFVADDFRSRAEVEALLNHASIEVTPVAKDDGETKSCFGEQEYYDETDADCKKCEVFSECGKQVMGDTKTGKQDAVAEVEAVLKEEPLVDDENFPVVDDKDGNLSRLQKALKQKEA